MEMLSADSYDRLPHRGRVDMLPAVARALEKVVAALPTTIAPRDRAGLITSILDDLEDQPDSPSKHWPEDLKALALTAIKTLGRNPIGSEALAERKHLGTVLYHAGLLDSARTPPVSFKRQGPASPSSSDGSEGDSSTPKKLHRRSLSTSPSSHSVTRAKLRLASHEHVGLSPRQSEAISILANTITLHPVLGRKNAMELGAGRGALRMLRAGCEAHAQVSHKGKERESSMDSSHEESVFLLSRLLFLLTVQPGRFVLAFVDDETGVATLVTAIDSLTCWPSSYKALSEVLKLLYTVIAQYQPSIIAVKGGAPSPSDSWNAAFDPLLPILIRLVHDLKVIDLLPPLTNVINALTLFPVSDELAPLWLGSHTDDHARPTETHAQDRSGESPKKRSIYDRIARSLSGNGRKSPPGEGSASLSPGSAASSSPRSSHDSSRSDAQQSTTVHRLLSALDNFLSNTMPPLPLGPDDPLPMSAKGVVMDEILPPVFGLFTSLAMGSSVLRGQIKAELLPDNMDRSPSSVPLEKRPNLLGHLLRFLRAAAHPQTQQTLDHFFWALCDSNADTVTREIGYGNAAGLLFRRGIAVPQHPKEEAHIEEIDDDPVVPRSNVARDPITSLKPEASPPSNPLAGMSDEEQEREAERLFTLFDRMDRNPAMKMVNPMDEAVRKGDVEKWDRADAEEELRKLHLQEDLDEAEAIKEMAAWKARKSKT